MKNLKKINPSSLIGNKYGNLTVIKGLYINQSKGPTFHWMCKCDCGKIVNVRNSIITKRVGCHNCSIIIKKKIKDPKFALPHYSLKRRAYLNYIQRAKSKKLAFTLTESECFKLFDDPCYYCGSEPNVCRGKFKGNSVDGDFKRNGIDRINSSKDYSKENTVSCCRNCNTIKLAFSQENFLNWIEKVYNYQNIKRSSTIPEMGVHHK